MSGTKILLDTNAVLYLLGGKLKASALPEGNLIISIINELELLSYPDLNKSEENNIKDFVNSIDVIGLDPGIKLETISLRKKYRIKLPDAIICATALLQDAALVTFDENLLKVEELKIIRPELINSK